MMPIEVMFFVGSQFFAMLVFSVIGLVAVGYRQRALQREMVLMGAEQPLEAYQRFAAARFRIFLVVRNVYIVVILVGIVGIFAVLPTMLLKFVLANSISLPQPLYLEILIVIALLIGLYFGAYVHDVVGAVLVDAEALRISQMSSLQRGDILALKIRAVLLKVLPLLLYFELLGGILILGGNFYFALFLLLVLVFAAHVFAAPLYALTALLSPIEETQWIALVPRIAAWAQLAGVEFASVQIQQDLVGTSNVYTIGLRRPTLVISETFLRYSEWRQQDAMIAIGIGMVRKHINRNTFMRALLVLALAAFFLAVIPFLSISTFDAFSLAPFLLVFYLLMIGVRIVSQRFLRGGYFGVDRVAALLTGDPLAVMVVLNTLNALNGMPSTQRSARVPPASERMQKLDALIWRSWPRAPQATMAVPASTAVSFGPYYLTVPLTQATSPGPVPSAPYGSLV